MWIDVQTGVLANLVVEGRLQFEQNRKLRSRHIYIRPTGWINAKQYNADSDKDIPVSGEIELWGMSESQYLTAAQNLEAGDKLIVNTGRLEIMGKEQPTRMYRLSQNANWDSSSIYVDVEGDIFDWNAGDTIALAPTGFAPNESERFVIQEIIGNRIDLDRHPSFEYFGSNVTEEFLIAGVDIRGEVAHLSRSFKISNAPYCTSDTVTIPDHCWNPTACEPLPSDCSYTCNPVEEQREWGFGVLTEDVLTGEWGAYTHLENVEFNSGSQWDTSKASVMFWKSKGRTDYQNIVKGCTFYNGYGAAFELDQAENVHILSNTVHDHTQFGIKVLQSSNWILKWNYFFSIRT